MEKNNVEQPKATVAKVGSGTKKQDSNSANLPGSNYKTRYYLAAKKRHCSSYSTNQLKPSNKGSRGFAKCPSCLKWFSSRSALSIHQKKYNHWSKVPECTCPICNKNFLYVGRRNKHVQNHLFDQHKSEAGKFLSDTTCSFCQKCFLTKQQKVKHVGERHPSSKSVEVLSAASSKKNCAYQNKVKQGVKRLPAQNSSRIPPKVKNMIKLSAKKLTKLKPLKKPLLPKSKALKCPFCSHTYSNSQGLTRHLKQKHHSLLQFQCSVCRAKFPSFVQALTHARRQHKGSSAKKLVIKKFQKCKSPVKSVGSGSSSSRNDKDDSVSLPLSEKDVATSGDSPEPNSEGHKLSCLVCHIKKFSCLRSLKRHQNSLQHKRNESMQRDESPTVNIVRDMSVVCSVCKEECANIQKFVLHRMTHFVSDCDINSSEANISYCYCCEICGDQILGIKKVQFHLLWHSYTVRCARSSGAASTNPGQPCSCGKNPAPKSTLFTCYDCKCTCLGKAEYVAHKLKGCNSVNAKNSMSNGNSCAKYCFTHNTELCCLTGSNVDGSIHHKEAEKHSSTGANEIEAENAVASSCDVILLNSSHENVISEETTDSLKADTVQRLSDIGAKAFVQSNRPAFACSICKQGSRSLKEFKEHLCPLVDESSCSEQDSSTPRESFSKKLRHRSSVVAESSANDETAREKNRAGNSCPYISDSFHENLSKLLFLLISDGKLALKLGWGKRPIEEIVLDMLKCFGKQTFAKRNGMTDGEVFRSNVHTLLQLCLKDTVLEQLTDFDSVDSMVKNALLYVMESKLS